MLKKSIDSLKEYWMNQFLNRTSIEYLKYHEKITSDEYKELFKCSGRTARMDLNHLVKLMVLKKIGRGKKIRYILQDYFRQVKCCEFVNVEAEVSKFYFCEVN